MIAMLELFLSEARELLQSAGETLMRLEKDPGNVELMTGLFRAVHTLKGNCSLFEFPEMARVLHAGETLMDEVRLERVAYSRELADRLLDAMDFVAMLCDEIEAQGSIGAVHAAASARLEESLRQLIPERPAAAGDVATPPPQTPRKAGAIAAQAQPVPLADIPESVRMDAYRHARGGAQLHWLDYAPEEQSIFRGEDPFFQARNTPGILWGSIGVRAPWPKLAELDAYRCMLDFHLLSSAPREELDGYFRTMPDRVRMLGVAPLALALPQGEPNGGPVYEDFVADALGLARAGDTEGLRRAAGTLLELSSPDLWLASALRWLLLVMELEPHNAEAQRALIESLRHLEPPQWTEERLSGNIRAPQSATPAPQTAAALALPASFAGLAPEEAQTLMALVAAQRDILALSPQASGQPGRIKAVTATLSGCLAAAGDLESLSALEAAKASALDEASTAPLLVWLEDKFRATQPAPTAGIQAGAAAAAVPLPASAPEARLDSVEAAAAPQAAAEGKFGRRNEDAAVVSQSIKVDQAKIDRLMNLIGEMVVSKNALPYLAARAETVFGVRDLAREIKAQYAVINRIAGEMQDAIMQVRMLPVSFVLQRFVRLVRDTSHSQGKEVNLVLEGGETEADKNIIESLGDPLMHIVRNSLDHGFEQPEVRRAAGKPAAGTLTIRASQESGRVLIEVSDDGKGIDPALIKRKAYGKGLVDEDALERMSDQDAVNLVFAPGLTTAEVASDLSGRGVGMDVVRTAVEMVNGTVVLESEKGKGTRIRLSLPLSMAVTQVMIVESDGQIFGLPMDCVVETVRVARSAIRSVKQSLAMVLRGSVVPLKSLNRLLGLDAAPKANAEDQLAVLVVHLGNDSVGLLVDEFRETADIILKPMAGVLGGICAYSGTALMGDGSVLMVLNPREML